MGSHYFFLIDRLALIFVVLVLAVGLNAFVFSLSYLQGQKKYSSFLKYFIGLIGSLCLLFLSNHLILSFLAWISANFCISHLVVLKERWKPARETALLMQRNFRLGSFFLAVSIISLFFSDRGFFISEIIEKKNIKENFDLFKQIAQISLIVAAVAQSGLIPFHKWLLSSMNLPTPVSALMHGGFIASGHFLLLRIYPLWIEDVFLSQTIFFLGSVSVILGGLWKLVQPSIKGVLVCSTLAQLGFAFMQIGAGLLPYAIAHLVMHSFFKAYLFLGSSSALGFSKPISYQSCSFSKFFVCLLSALGGTYIFLTQAQLNFFVPNTEIFLGIFVFISIFEFSKAIHESFEEDGFKTSLVMFGIVSVLSFLYGSWLRFLEIFLDLPVLPYPLGFVHISFILLFLTIFFVFSFCKKIILEQKWFMRLYVILVNSSRSDQKTLETFRVLGSTQDFF